MAHEPYIFSRSLFPGPPDITTWCSSIYREPAVESAQCCFGPGISSLRVDSSAVDVSCAKLPTSTVATVQDVADDVDTSESDDGRMDHSSQGRKRRASSSSDDFITPNRTAKKSSQIDSSVKVSNTFAALFTQSGAAPGQDDDVWTPLSLSALEMSLNCPCSLIRTE